MILSSLITISDWLSLVKQKSTFNFEREMLLRIQLRSLKNEKDFNILTEFKCRSYYEVDCVFSAS